MKTTNTIHVAFAINDKFAPHLGAAIASLLLNASSSERINIYVLQQDLNHSNRHNLMQLEKLRHNTHIDLLKVDRSKFISLPVVRKNHVIETYFRLRLPTMLPKIDKLIYLDADVIVMGNIKKLWDQEMGDNILLAVEEPKYMYKNRLKSLSMKGDSLYFNAGVLLMNLKKMRAFGLEKQVHAYVSKRLRFPKHQDQDILNALFENRWQALPLAFNAAYPFVYNKHGELGFDFYTSKDITLAKKSPHIIHFCMYPKPWHPGCTDLRSKYYWKYLKKTGFEVREQSLEMKMKMKMKMKIKRFLARNMSFIVYNNFLKKPRLLSMALEILRWPTKNIRRKKTK